MTTTASLQSTAFMQVYEEISEEGTGTPWAGDATHPAYDSVWSNVRYMQLPVVQEVTSAESSDTPRAAGRAEFPDLTVIKDSDQMSPKLFATCASGGELDLVVLEYTVYDGVASDLDTCTPRYVVFLQGVKICRFEIDEHRLHRRDFDITQATTSSGLATTFKGPETVDIPTGTHGQLYEDAIASSIDKLKLTYDQISISFYSSGTHQSTNGWDRAHNVPFDFLPGSPDSTGPRIWLGSGSE